jgi:AAA domain
MSGEAFLGHPIVRRGGVLFIAIEGANEIAIRLQGAIEHKGGIQGRAPFAWTEACPPLLHKDAATELAKLAVQASEKLAREFGLPLSLIVVDTVVAAAGFTKDGQENDAALGQAIMRTLAQLARLAKCFVFGVDHFGKAVETGTRGSSAKEGAADVVLALLGDKAVTGEMTNTRLALRKLRSGAAGQEHPFTPRIVDMDLDHNGQPLTTLVLDWGAAPEAKASKDDWGYGKSTNLLRRIIMRLLADCGIDLAPWADGPMVRALNLKMVRTEFLKSYYAEGDTPKKARDAKAAAFKRAIDIAIEKTAIVVREVGDEHFVWLTKPPRPTAAT